MKTMTQFVFKISLIAVLLFTVGCSLLTQPTAEVEPTQDVGAIKTSAVAEAIVDQSKLLDAAKTEAVATAVAAITEDAKLNPSPTVSVPTLAPTSAVSATATATVIGVPPVITVKPPVVIVPTKTAYTDNCSVVSTTPSDYQVLTPGQDFDGTWVLKNTGKVTWTDGQYYIRFQSGNIPHKNDVYYISGDVKVNETVEVRADMLAPKDSGTYVSNWAVINNVGMPFCYIYVAITIP